MIGRGCGNDLARSKADGLAEEPTKRVVHRASISRRASDRKLIRTLAMIVQCR
jgi:hypothetical protein